MDKRLTRTRLILAIISTLAEEIAIWAIWQGALPAFGIRLHVALMVLVMVAWAAFGTWLFIFTTRILKKQVDAGTSFMTGATGEAVRDLDPNGMVRIKGELWQAVSAEGKIGVGEEVEVVSQNGLKLSVRRMESVKR
jgi:membrane-bound serine protease (ClpP class)